MNKKLILTKGTHMKALLVTALLALAFTTGFTCSKNAPEAAAPTETTAPVETAAPAEAAGTAEAAVAPATTETAPATETK